MIIVIQEISGKQYHFNSGGYMDTGWTKVDGRWYYLGARNDGAKKTYWQKVYGKYYWLGSNGVMRTGWQQVYGKYYWLGGSNDGAMKTGWQKVGKYYYWLDHSNDGAMKTGWQTVYGKKYYLGSSNDGAMKTGWQQISGSWYYFGGVNDGSLKTNTWIGNYHVDASGKWDKSKNNSQKNVKYLGSDIKSYNNGIYYKEFNGDSSFKLGGRAYRKGFTIGTYTGEGYVNYNLEGKYNYISGVVGNVDGISYSVTYSIIGDGRVLGTIDVKAANLPQEFEFNVSGVKRLTIVADGKYNYGKGVGFGNIVVYKNSTDKPRILSNEGTVENPIQYSKNLGEDEKISEQAEMDSTQIESAETNVNSEETPENEMQEEIMDEEQIVEKQIIDDKEQDVNLDNEQSEETENLEEK